MEVIMRIKRICILVFPALLFLTTHVCAFSVEIIEKLEENQGKIQDISADVVMEIDAAGRVLVRETKMWREGDKTRIDLVKSEKSLPMTVIIDVDKMTIRQEGEKPRVIDMKEVKDKGKDIPQTAPGMELQKGMGEFLRNSDVTIVKEEGNEINLSVIPEESNPLMQKLDMVVDMEKGVITQQKMYSNMGISFCSMEYEKKDNIWVLKRFTMTSNLGQMGTSRVTAEYENVKINKGIEDGVFE
jgi:outer membrane lipoprotein-sorting protein